MKALGRFDFNGIKKEPGEVVSLEEQKKLSKEDLEKLIDRKLVEIPVKEDAQAKPVSAKK